MTDAPTLLELLLKHTLRNLRVDTKKLGVTLEGHCASLFQDLEAAETRMTVTLRFSKTEVPR